MHTTHDTGPAPAAWLAVAAERGWRTETCPCGTAAHIACPTGCDDADLGLPAGSDGA